MTETAEVTTALPVDFTTDTFLATVHPMITADLTKLEEIAAMLKRYSPPSVVTLYAHIKDNPNGNEAITVLNERKTALQGEIDKLTKQLHEIAKTELMPESLPEDDLAKLRVQFDSTKGALTGKINSAISYTEVMGKTAAGTALKDIKVPQFRTGVSAGSNSSGELTAPQLVRKWAEENWNGAKPADRGRIPADLQAAYDAAHNGSSPA
jgi:hypothetical protein